MTGRLLSVNVGRPRQVEWEGKTVRTAIWKDPVDGPRMVRRINIDGDDQADRLAHGGEHRAVFVYQIDSYRYWERELGRDDFSYGQFGENFTVEGLADDEVCIGDRYRIGDALFEVTQPRVTCYRVGIRMNEPGDADAARLAPPPRVLSAGSCRRDWCRPGDEIDKVADGPEQLTVADIDALLYLPNKSRPLLERALRVPALSEGWQGSFRELLAKADRGTPSAPAWAGFQPLRVAEIRRESSTDRVVPARADAGHRLDAEAAPGQYLTVRVRPRVDRAADPQLLAVGRPDERGYRISVKREGAGSRYLHDASTSATSWTSPLHAGVSYCASGTRPVVLISAGVGATPVLAMLHALAREHSTRQVWWLHGARNHARACLRRPRSTSCLRHSPTVTALSPTASPPARTRPEPTTTFQAGST